jgi:predicted NBD/HSP70 family sugar kinase
VTHDPATMQHHLEPASSDLEAVGVGSRGEIDRAEDSLLLAANVSGSSERVDLGPLISEELGGAQVTIDNDVRVARRCQRLGAWVLAASRAP